MNIINSKMLKSFSRFLLHSMITSLKEIGIGFAAALFLIVAVALILGPLFGIGWAIDAHSDWWGLMIIPYFLFFKLLSKPLCTIFGVQFDETK